MRSLYVRQFSTVLKLNEQKVLTAHCTRMCSQSIASHQNVLSGHVAVSLSLYTSISSTSLILCSYTVYGQMVALHTVQFQSWEAPTVLLGAFRWKSAFMHLYCWHSGVYIYKIPCSLCWQSHLYKNGATTWRLSWIAISYGVIKAFHNVAHIYSIGPIDTRTSNLYMTQASIS